MTFLFGGTSLRGPTVGPEGDLLTLLGTRTRPSANPSVDRARAPFHAVRRRLLLTMVALATAMSIGLLDTSVAFAATSTPSPAQSPAPPETPAFNVGGNQSLWFIGIIAMAVALLWFSLLAYDVRSTNKWRREDQKKMIEKMIEGATKRGNGLSVEEVRQLVSAMDRPPRGTSGLTQSLLALTIVTLVGRCSCRDPRLPRDRRGRPAQDHHHLVAEHHGDDLGFLFWRSHGADL